MIFLVKLEKMSTEFFQTWNLEAFPTGKFLAYARGCPVLDALGCVCKPADNKIINFSSTSDQDGVGWLDLPPYMNN